VVLADGPCRVCSSRVLRVLARLRFRSADGPLFAVRSCLADSPRAPRGRSVIRGASLEVLLPFSDSPRLGPDGPRQGCGQSVMPYRTIRDTLPDNPRGLCGPSASPGRTVRQRLAALFLGSIPPSFRASTCASRNHS
jgi:hypothetical protein